MPAGFEHAGPQSCLKTPTPNMPLKPASAGLWTAPGHMVDVDDVAILANVESMICMGTVTVGSLARVTPAR